MERFPCYSMHPLETIDCSPAEEHVPLPSSKLDLQHLEAQSLGLDPPVPRTFTLPDGKSLLLETCIGRGGFGEAWIARREGESTTLVGKFLHAQALSEDRAHASIERMRTEIGILARLSLEGIPALLGHGEHEGHPYLLLQRIQGITWRELQRTVNGPMPLPFLLHSCREQAQAVGALHARGIVHSDLKPENLLFGQADGMGEWRSWIIDFGLARDITSSITRVTAEGQTVGTHGYLDPRHVERALERDFAGDVYALGATWYEWYTGQPLFSDPQWHRILRIHREGTLASCEETFNEHVRRRLESCADLPHENRCHAFEELLRDMLLYESPTHVRPSLQHVTHRLQILSPLHRSRLAAATSHLRQPEEVIACIAELGTRKSSSTLRIIGGIACAVTLSIAGLLATTHSSSETPETSSASLPPVRQIHETPKVPPSLTGMLRDEVLIVRHGEEIILQADLRTSPIWGSTARPELSVRGLTLDAKELTVLLERLKRGSSAGLPKRAYICYCSQRGTEDGIDLLLVTPRGALHASASGSTFYDQDALHTDITPSAQKHLIAWGLQGKILDTTLRGASGLTSEDQSKSLVRANEYLRAFQQRAQIRPKASRTPSRS
jgi:serine/threonine protein kinase